MAKLKYSIPGEIEYIEFKGNNIQAIHYFISRAGNVHNYVVYPTFTDNADECDENTWIDITTKSDGLIDVRIGDFICYENGSDNLNKIDSDKIFKLESFNINK